jgi:hypothetical protein
MIRYPAIYPAIPPHPTIQLYDHRRIYSKLHYITICAYTHMLILSYTHGAAHPYIISRILFRNFAFVFSYFVNTIFRKFAFVFCQFLFLLFRVRNFVFSRSYFVFCQAYFCNFCARNFRFFLFVNKIRIG